MEDDKEARGTILEWMETIVPGVEKIKTEQQQLDSKTALPFKEQGTKRHFPAHMVSDGTIYALSLLVAVLDLPQPYGLTLIEEPERGLHPAVIRELIGLMREQATPRNHIWLTTHSESVVRALLAPLGLDEAWLSNLLGGGLPW